MDEQRGFPTEVFRIVAPPMILLASVAIFVWLSSLRAEPKTEEPKEAVELVSTTTVEPQNDGLDIKVNGTVVPFREISLSAEVAGIITWKADECRAGHFVTKGTPLLKIDPRDYDLAVRQIKEEVEQAQGSLDEIGEEIANTKELIEVSQGSLELAIKELQRLQKLAQKNYATESQIDQETRNVLSARNALLSLKGTLAKLNDRKIVQQSMLDTSRVRLEKAELDLERTTISAPIDGVVVSDFVEVDSYANKGTLLTAIEDTSAVEVRCSLRMDELYWIWRQPHAQLIGGDNPQAQRDYQIPKTAVTVEYKLDGTTYSWDGILSRFEGIGLDQETRTVPCRVLVRTPRSVKDPAKTGPMVLVRGMFVHVIIHVQPKADLMKVPEIAIRPGGLVWRVRDGKLNIVKVHVISVRDKSATIRVDGSELVVGDKVVETPLAFVEDGMAVKEQDQKQAQEKQAQQ